MVARSDGYFGLLLKGYCGVIQGYLLFPTLFNMPMDADIRHSGTVVVPTVEGLERRNLLVE